MDTMNEREIDYCESCFDKNLTKNEAKIKGIYFEAIEVPVLASGFPAHLDSKCASCYQKPIIGVKFKCVDCKKFDLCKH